MLITLIFSTSFDITLIINFFRFYEYALSKMGLSWQSSKVWETVIQYEQDHANRLWKVLQLYRRLICTPTKLYNRHWDWLVLYNCSKT